MCIAQNMCVHITQNIYIHKICTPNIYMQNLCIHKVCLSIYTKICTYTCIQIHIHVHVHIYVHIHCQTKRTIAVEPVTRTHGAKHVYIYMHAHFVYLDTHCNTLQHTATDSNTLQHTAATHCCNTMQHTISRCVSRYTKYAHTYIYEWIYYMQCIHIVYLDPPNTDTKHAYTYIYTYLHTQIHTHTRSTQTYKYTHYVSTYTKYASAYSPLQIQRHKILRLCLKTFNLVPGVPGFSWDVLLLQLITWLVVNLMSRILAR